MKRNVPLLLVFTLCLLLSLTACEGSGNTSTNPQSIPASSQSEPPISSEPEPSEPECEHVWTEANYQEPKTCTVCGETEGSPLTSAFEKNGYAINMVVGTAYDYTTLCYDNTSVSTVGKVTISDYKIIESDETHEVREGYEWRIVRVRSEFSDDNAWAYGNMFRQEDVNYYSGDFLDYYTNQDFYEESDDDIFTVNYRGEIYECLILFETLENGWKDRVYVFEYESLFLVPIGYDGVAMVFYNAALGSTELNDLASVTDTLSDIVDKDTLFLRLD